MKDGVDNTRARTTDDGACRVFAFDEDRVRIVREEMLSDDVVQRVAETFKVLAHPSRIRLVRALSNAELCVCDLAQVLGLSVSATSHQLQALKRMGLVRYRMEGKLAYYSLRDPFVLALLEDGVRHVEKGGAPPETAR